MKRATRRFIGSPPHAWGIPPGPHGPRVGVRFTPTRVGNTSGRMPKYTHPPGSPPHAWGIQRPGPSGACPQRFTPTRVGNTSCGDSISHVETVHPHTRGEYSLRADLAQVVARFTPTRVGNTPSHASRSYPPPVHPHTRGEYAGRASSLFNARGSPPRAWGIRIARHPGQQRLRFTPTRVGNTSTPIASRSRFPVHPHTRGEY